MYTFPPYVKITVCTGLKRTGSILCLIDLIVLVNVIEMLIECHQNVIEKSI